MDLSNPQVRSEFITHVRNLLAQNERDQIPRDILDEFLIKISDKSTKFPISILVFRRIISTKDPVRMRAVQLSNKYLECYRDLASDIHIQEKYTIVMVFILQRH